MFSVPLHVQIVCLTSTYSLIHRLSENPVCNQDNPFRPSKACNTTVGIPAYVATYGACGSQTCSNSLTVNSANTGDCNCVDPFKILLECRRPTFSSFSNELIADLQSALSTELGLQLKQVMVETAVFTLDGRADFNINFFSADGVSPLDQATITNITFSLNHQVPPLSDFEPYVLVWVEARSLNLGKSP